MISLSLGGNSGKDYFQSQASKFLDLSEKVLYNEDDDKQKILLLLLLFSFSSLKF